MFNLKDNFSYCYVPILGLKPAEMAALEELPEKDKDKILPIFLLKGWVGSKSLDKSLSRIDKAIGDRVWIADIDENFLSGVKKDSEGKYPREVFHEIENLFDYKDGYDNWYKFLLEHENLIPVLQLEELSSLSQQIDKLSSLGRGLVCRICASKVKMDELGTITKALMDSKVDDLMVVFDHEDIDRRKLITFENHSVFLSKFSDLFDDVLLSVSSSSFPSSFSGVYRGEIPIYERLYYNKIERKIGDKVRLVYSDRGSARAKPLSGGGVAPPPRVDYPLRNDWRFVRKEYQDADNIEKGEKESLYKSAAIEVVNSDYWSGDLRLWGTQMIEKTTKGDKYGITSPNRATAVRINIHLYQQLHYHDKLDEIDTEEDWID